MGLIGILLGLALLIWLALRGWSVLLLAPAAALLAAAFAGEPLLASWTQTFMFSAATFLAQFFPLFLLGALFGKLMDDSGSVAAISRFMTERMGARRAILAVVLAGALVTSISPVARLGTREKTSTAVVSSLKWPAAMAASAFWCEASANASCASRETFHWLATFSAVRLS